MANAVGFSPVSLGNTPYPTAMPAAAGTDKIKKVSKDFESVFITNMFESMYEGLDDDGPFGAGANNGVWRSLLTEEYAKSMAAKGGIGIAKQIQQQLISLQEKKA
ncbi:MAG TPA: rod-binding protein [Xanthobacteraceae bacterium]|nr:rod-binding protein [Xanthobacteraceae bacterium]